MKKKYSLQYTLEIHNTLVYQVSSHIFKNKKKTLAFLWTTTTKQQQNFDTYLELCYARTIKK